MMNVKKAIEYLFYIMLVAYFVGKVFEPITILIDILFCFYMYKNKQEAIDLYNKYKNLIISFVLLLTYFILQSSIAENPLLSIKSSFGTIRFMLLFFASLLVFDSKNKIYNIIYFSFIGIGIVCIDSIYQYFMGVDLLGKSSYGGGARLTAWNHMPKVNVMMGQFFGLLICAPIILKEEKKLLAIFMLIIATTVFIISGNRSPLVALFSSIILIGLFSKNKKHIIGFLLLFVLIFSYALSTKKMNSSLSAILNPNSSSATSGRIPIYLTSIEMIKDNPFFGIGANQFQENFRYFYEKVDFKNQYKKYYMKVWDQKSPMHVHSVLFDIIVSFGIVGFLLYTIILYQIFIKFIYKNNLGILASIGLLYCITPLQFSRSFTQSEWQFITYLGLILLATLSKYYELNEKNEKIS